MIRRIKLFCICLLFCSVSGMLNAQVKTTKAPAKKPVPKTQVPTSASAKSQAPVKAERLVEITTDYGVMIAKLYNSTPLHRDNFIKLVQQGFYDSLLFHRVIENFMIQGGDPVSKNAQQGMQLGSGAAPGERVPAEFVPIFFHKKGALAAARDNNPQKASSNCQFYIVQGQKQTEEAITGVQQRLGSYAYTTSQREIYKRIGGTPSLDQNYTVFGEVISGLNVIDRIAKAAKDGSDRPLQNVIMKMRLLN